MLDRKIISSISKSSWLIVLATTTCLGVILELLVNPSGNFPLNDDWSFTVGVKNLLDTGNLTITSWTLSAAIFHVITGATFCKLVGFSFEALRVYTLLLAALSLFMLSLILKRIGASAVLMFFTLFVVLTDPLFFSLSNTFMTDVPTTALALVTVFLLSKSFSQDKYLGSACIFSALATSNREVTIVVALSFLLACLLERSQTPSKQSFRLILAAAPLLCALCVIAIHAWWLIHGPGIPFCMLVEKQFAVVRLGSGLLYFINTVIGAFLRLTLYLGLLMLPLALYCLPATLAQLAGKQAKLFWLITAELALLLPAGLLVTHNLMPLGDNIIYDLGLGPMLILTSDKPLPQWTKAPPLFWLIITLFSGTGAALLLAQLAAVTSILIQRLRGALFDIVDRTILFVAILWVTYTTIICIRSFFDRYLVLLIPITAILFVYGTCLRSATKSRLAVKESPAVFRCAALVAAILLAIFSVAGTYDYFSWNRARWQALNDALKKDKLNPTLINGGNEFNYWFTYEPNNKYVDVTQNDERQGNHEYMVSLVLVEGYTIKRRYPFFSTLWGGTRELLFMKKGDDRG